MNVLPDVYICPLRKKGAPLLPEGTVKCTLLAAYQVHRGCLLKSTKVAIAEIRISVESGTVKYLKTILLLSCLHIQIFFLLAYELKIFQSRN